MDPNGNRQKDYFQLLNEKGRKREPFLFIIDFEENKPLIFSLPVPAKQLLFRFGPQGNDEGLTLPRQPLEWLAHPIPLAHFEQAFTRVRNHLLRGDSFLTNLTFPTPLTTNYSLFDIYAVARAPYKLHLPGHFTLFSPESFVKIHQNQIFSFPMKGTIDARIPHAREKLLADEKELAEHYTIVDLIRNDLNRVAKGVRVEKFRYVEEIKNPFRHLLQISSRISGNVGPHWQDRIGSLLADLLPAGSISGAPKPKTLEIIREAEAGLRGYYTGITGIFDGETLDSAVMIRFVGQQPGRLEYRSGGGITIHSDMLKEYQELLDKIYVPTL